MKPAEYQRYLKSWTWRYVRARALERAGNRCEACPSTFNLEVHHKNYERVGGQELPGDLEVLCSDCHAAKHGKERPRGSPRRGPRFMGAMSHDAVVERVDAKKRHLLRPEDGFE